MSLSSGERSITSPRVLLVDDDRRVLELLDVAYTSHGFTVSTAIDGNEALQRAFNDRPDLMVLDVRMPKKNGIEVCEQLRRDPEQCRLPIILVSASGETDARLRGLAAGADDFLAKPFSPRELIARSRRLLARVADAADAERRTRDLERALSRAQDEAQRSSHEMRGERYLREISLALARSLLPVLDLDELARQILIEVQSRFQLGAAGLLVLDDSEAAFVPRAVRGDEFDRVAQLRFALDGPLAHVLSALGRTASWAELQRLPELAGELPALVASRFTRITPLSGPDRLEGLLLLEEPREAIAPSSADRERLDLMGEIAGVALHASRRFRAQLEVDLEWALAGAAGDSPCARESAEIVRRAARGTLLAPRIATLVTLAAALDPTALDDTRREALERLSLRDPTGQVADLLQLCELERAEARGGASNPPAGDAEWLRAARLLVVARRYTALCARGSGPAASRAGALAAARLDPTTARAFDAAAREVEHLAALAAVRPATS